MFELDDETPVMVMDCRSVKRSASGLPARVRCPFIKRRRLLPVVSAVGTAHSRGVVHRDFKPETILAENEEGQTEIKVLDFGIAKLANVEGESVTQSQLTGTLFHALRFGGASHRLPRRYLALGVVLYECLSNQLPVYGENLSGKS